MALSWKIGSKNKKDISYNIILDLNIVKITYITWF